MSIGDVPKVVGIENLDPLLELWSLFLLSTIPLPLLLENRESSCEQSLGYEVF